MPPRRKRRSCGKSPAKGKKKKVASPPASASASDANTSSETPAPAPTTSSKDTSTSTPTLAECPRKGPVGLKAALPDVIAKGSGSLSCCCRRFHDRVIEFI